jgi:hypothetical protein
VSGVEVMDRVLLLPSDYRQKGGRELSQNGHLAEVGQQSCQECLAHESDAVRSNAGTHGSWS